VIVGPAAAAGVLDQPRGPRWVGVVGIAPAQQVQDDRPELPALARGPVFVARGALLVGDALEQPLVDEALEARG